MQLWFLCGWLAFALPGCRSAAFWKTADLNMKSAVKQAADQAEKNTGSSPLKQ